MGFYSDFGEMLSPEKAAAIQGLLKKDACLQLVLVLKRFQNVESSKHLVKWGYELEGHFLKINEQKQLQLCFQSFHEEKDRTPFPMLPEYGSWMFQILPLEAFTKQTDLSRVVASLRNIYQYFQKREKMILTIPNIPFLGASKGKNQNNQLTKSLYIDDRYILNHPRVRTMTKNAMIKRNQRIQIYAPLFFDEKTNKQEISETQPDPKFIFMDAIAYGPGMASLQCTFSTENLYNTQFIHDNMHIISPLMLAMTAGTPFFKGKISDWDVRWRVLEETSDCRRNEQRDKNNKLYIPNSRYSPSRFFICPNEFNKKQYNDLKSRIDPELKQFIKRASDEKQIKIGEAFLDHLASIVSRDLLFVTQNLNKMVGENQTLFDVFNCSDMPSVRLKFPTGDSVGWRAEFRTMEAQLTAQQNAAFCLLIYFFNSFMLEYQDKINLYVPMSFVHQNFERALTNDSLRKQKFWFRTNIFENGDPKIEELSLEQIFLGSEKEGTKFIGISNLMKEFFINSENDVEFKKIVEQAFKFLEQKVTGQRITLAQWMRAYVKKHPDYKSNSIIPKKTMDDLLKNLYEISRGNLSEKNFRPIFSL